MRNHIQHLGFGLVLYVVTALVRYTPYSPGRGRLTITNSMPHILVMLVAGLKIILLCLAYLFVLVTCITEHNNSENTCPLWHIESKNGECVCGANYYNTVTCDKNCTYCVATVLLGAAPLTVQCSMSAFTVPSGTLLYRIPNNVSGTMLK